MRRILAVAGAGLLYALALPPFGWSWAGWIALAPLVAAVRSESLLSALWLGTLAGYVAGWATQWWFAETVRHYFAVSGPASIGATMASALVVWGVPFGSFAAAAAYLERRAPRAAVPWLVAASWVATEFLRTRIIGQPWGLLGYTQHAALPIVQIAAVTGVYGVSFLLALVAAAIAERWGAWRAGVRSPRAVLASLAACLLVPAAAWAYGRHTLGAPPLPARTQTVTLVQANVPPERHWTRAYGERQLRAHIALTQRALATADPQLVVWPENAVPRYPERDPLLAARLARMVAEADADLVFGAPRSGASGVHNSVRLLQRAGGPMRHYDKHRLVPMAEAPLLPASRPATEASPESFTPGTGSAVLASVVPLGLSICHEVLHPDLIAGSVRDGAALLVNVANDGLADQGYSTAAGQHAAMAIFRAVETRRFLVRAAATGPSLVVDPRGRVVASLPQGVAGTITARVAPASTRTPYVVLGDAFAGACLVAVLGALLPVRLRLRRARPALAPSPW